MVKILKLYKYFLKNVLAKKEIQKYVQLFKQIKIIESSKK